MCDKCYVLVVIVWGDVVYNDFGLDTVKERSHMRLIGNVTGVVFCAFVL
jgi:hypothetical protein